MSPADAESNKAGLQRAVEVASVPPGTAVTVTLGKQRYAICNDGGTVFACEDACPHAGASLGCGIVRAGAVICRRHRWPWDLRTGLTDSKLFWMRLERYRCEVCDGFIWIDTSAPISS